MRSAFFGFHVASSALFTARGNLNVISHNISNVEIPGFSRQVAQAQANMPLSLRDGRGMYGTGSRVTGIIQIRDHFLDRQFWSQRAVLGQNIATNNHLTFVEIVFNELPGAGVLRSFNDFFARLHNLTENTSAPTFRNGVITQAETLAEMINHNARALQRQQMDINREVSDTVGIINSLGAQITRLNEQIRIFEQDGSNANDLRDQRALLIDQLSELVNVSVEERDFSTPENPNDRRLFVMINGHDFINNDMLNRLEVRARADGAERNEMDVRGLYDIFFTNGSRFDIYSRTLSGTLRGLIDVRDGNGGHSTVQIGGNNVYTSRFSGIPFYMNQLNLLVRTFATAMNEGRNVDLERIPGTIGHIFGFDANGNNTQMMMFDFVHPITGETAVLIERDANGNPVPDADNNGIRRWLLINTEGEFVAMDSFMYGVPGVGDIPAGYSLARDELGNPLFTLDKTHMNALNFRVNPRLTASGGDQFLATTSNPDDGASSNDVIIGFNKIGTDGSLFREGRLIDFIISVNDQLAIDRRQARNFRISYEEIVMQTHNNRLSIKGVDINEEMMNLVRFQTMFTAASRLVNVLDNVYDTLINRLGNI